MRELITNPNIDNSDPTNYPGGRLKNNDGSGNGTPVDEKVYGDYHQTIVKLMARYGIVGNGLPDNTTNGYQILEALIALPSKNDFVNPMTSASGVLNVPIKINFLEENEAIDFVATTNYANETQIKGIGNTLFSVTSGPFKSGEYVRLIKVSGSIKLIRLVDSENIEDVVTVLGYLKAATYAQEIAGTSNTVATNPQTNALAFVERVNGASSSVSLASLLRNGLYPKEHFQIVANIDNGVVNKGSVSNVDPGFAGSVGTTLPVDGFTSASYMAGSGPISRILVTMTTAMPNMNYKVNFTVESSGDIFTDAKTATLVFKKVSTTQFQIGIGETAGGSHNLKLHIEVVKL